MASLPEPLPAYRNTCLKTGFSFASPAFIIFQECVAFFIHFFSSAKLPGRIFYIKSDKHKRKCRKLVDVDEDSRKVMTF